MIWKRTLKNLKAWNWKKNNKNIQGKKPDRIYTMSGFLFIESDKLQ